MYSWSTRSSRSKGYLGGGGWCQLGHRFRYHGTSPSTRFTFFLHPSSKGFLGPDLLNRGRKDSGSVRQLVHVSVFWCK